MGAVAVSSELTEMQGRFVASYLQTGSVVIASEKAGYSGEQGGYGCLRSKNVQNALKEARHLRLTVEGASEAVTTMRELLKAPTPPAVRLAAARWLLEASGHGAKDRDVEVERPIHEMNEAQLRAFIAKSQAVVDEGGDPPVIVVVPDNGALPD